jgi:hypothetical protein
VSAVNTAKEDNGYPIEVLDSCERRNDKEPRPGAERKKRRIPHEQYR